MPLSLPEIDVLYVSYDGGLDDLAQAQIWPYLLENARKGVRFHVVTFEKPRRNSSQRDELARLSIRVERLGIRWTRRSFHCGGSLAKFLDVLSGLLAVLSISLRRSIRIVHARSYVAGLLALLLKVISGRKFIFDLRGFWVDERAESGLWKSNGFRYRLWKFLETQMLKRSDLIITLSKASASLLVNLGLDRERVMVIPTCVDTDKFKPSMGYDRNQRTIQIVYTGSIGTWYLLDDMIRYFRLLAERHSSQFILITPGDHNLVRQRLREFGMKEDQFTLLRANYEVMPKHLSQADVGIVFYRPGFSRVACCPTKVGEYLSCGLPVVINRGIGDCDNLVSKERVGVLVDGFSQAQLTAGVEELLSLLKDESLSARCRALSQKVFDLKTGSESYYKAYAKVMGWI